MTISFGLLGAGAQAAEISDYAYENNAELSFLAVDKEYLHEPSFASTIDINQPTNEQLEIPIIAAVGAPAVKRQLLTVWQGTEYGRIIANTSWVSKLAEIELGVVVSPQAAISRSVYLGRHVLVNLGCRLSHDVEVGAYTTISPGVNIGGRVVIGEGVFIGLGASIKNDVKIAAGSVIGAGAVVLEDVMEENSVVVGVPGRVVKHNQNWLQNI